MKLELKKLEPIKKSYNKTGGLMLIAILAGGVLFGIQVWLSGEVATVGQQINQYEERKQELLLEQARLQERYNNLSSLESIQAKADEMGLVRVEPGSINYVSALDSFASLFQK